MSLQGQSERRSSTTENLEHIDVVLIDRARTSIDMAAYVLTDWAMIQALIRAANRGAAMRVYPDSGQIWRARSQAAFSRLEGDAWRPNQGRAVLRPANAL
jgi:phosphatidylserine/phosphatidylglycerophosphate/cardiolipin synthase-like enzyme